MRKMEDCIIATFHTTTVAMALEAYCSAHGIRGRMIPVPSGIRAGCGMCWKTAVDGRAELEQAVKDAGVEFQDLYACVDGVFFPIIQNQT